MTGQPAKRYKTFSEMLAPTLKNFVGWLAFYLICISFYGAAFDFQLSNAMHSTTPRSGLMGLALMSWTYLGWIPLVTILVRALMGQENTETPHGE